MNEFSKNYKKIVSIKKKMYSLEQEYIELDINIIDSDLKLLFSGEGSISFFYETIKLLPVDILKENFDKFVYLSIYGTSTEIYYFRKIILSMDKSFVYSNIKKSIESILKDLIVEEGYLDYLYRNIVILYKKLDEYEYLNDFLITHCKNHKDIDIYEIYEDYYIVSCPTVQTDSLNKK